MVQPSLGRQEVLKCILSAGDPRIEARFAREIRALGRVDHLNLVKVFALGSEGDQWYHGSDRSFAPSPGPMSWPLRLPFSSP